MITSDDIPYRSLIVVWIRRCSTDAIMSDDKPCLLKVGESMLAGEIEYRKGNFTIAFDHLREAVR